MASTLVRGKYVICKITGPASAHVIADGAVVQEGGQIIEVGSYPNLRARHPGAEVIGSVHHVVMPGLVNAHFHVGLSPFQLGAPDVPLELWGSYRMGAREVDPYLDHLYGCVLMLESGTTSVEVMHHAGRGQDPVNLTMAQLVLRAYQEAGLRVSYGPLVADQNLVAAGARGGDSAFLARLPAALAQQIGSLMATEYLPTEELLARAEEVYKAYGVNTDGLVHINVAPSNVHRCSDALLAGLSRLASEYRAHIHIHLQETVYQKLYGLKAWGKTPLQHLHELDFLGSNVTCGHSVWLTNEDLDLLATTGTSVCHNPSSNLRLQSGIAPVNRLLARGIRVALGTDEAGINEDKDMMQEMRLALKLHRVPGVENTPPTAYQVFQMATENGACMSGFGDRVGTLEPGKRADIVLMRLENIEEPFLDPTVSIVDSVVHRGRSSDIDTVIVDGRVVVKDRRLTTIDKEALYRELKVALDRPLLPREQARRDLGRQLEPYLRHFHAGTLPEHPGPHYFYNARA